MSAFIVAREHGQRSTYVAGCRCDACKAANVRRFRERRATIVELAGNVRPSGPAIPGTMRRGGRDVAILLCPGANGQSCVKPGTWLKGQEVCAACVERATVWDGLVDAKRALRHLRQLSRAGVGYVSVAEASDVCKTVLAEILAGKPRIRASTERKILAVDRDAIADHGLVDAKRTRELFAKLRARGFTLRHLAELLEYSSPATSAQVAGRDRVTAATERRIERIWRRAQLGEITPQRALVDAAEERAWLAHVLEKGVDAHWLSRRLGFVVQRSRTMRRMVPKNRDAVRRLRAEIEELARASDKLPDGWAWSQVTLLAVAFGFERGRPK